MSLTLDMAETVVATAHGTSAIDVILPLLSCYPLLLSLPFLSIPHLDESTTKETRKATKHDPSRTQKLYEDGAKKKVNCVAQVFFSPCVIQFPMVTELTNYIR